MFALDLISSIFSGNLIIYSSFSLVDLSPFFVCLFVFNLSLIGRKLLYNTVLVSTIYQHESAMGICTSPPS